MIKRSTERRTLPESRQGRNVYEKSETVRRMASRLNVEIAFFRDDYLKTLLSQDAPTTTAFPLPTALRVFSIHVVPV